MLPALGADAFRVLSGDPEQWGGDAAGGLRDGRPGSGDQAGRAVGPAGRLQAPGLGTGVSDQAISTTALTLYTS